MAYTVVEATWGLKAGVLAAMGLAAVELAVRWSTTGRVERMTLFSAGLVVGLGSLSLLSEDERFVLWTPAVGDLILAGLLMGALALGRSPLAAAARAQDPELPLHPLQERFLGAMSWRLGLNLLAHAALVGWSAGRSHELWLLVSGPVQYAMMGGQFVLEIAWARLVVLPRVEAEEDAERARSEEA